MEMHEDIARILSDIEIDEAVKIVYACESGSRAWGFPSRDSDYDVRFLYVRPIDWYISVFEKSDVIERKIDGNLDVNGWDLKKAFGMLLKSNPPLLEWLGSPIVYCEKYSIKRRMRELAKIFYSQISCGYHYLHMARKIHKFYLPTEHEMDIKKCFCILRSILALEWLEQGLGIVPTEFRVLLEKIVKDDCLKMQIEQLMELKLFGLELSRCKKNDVICGFIERELQIFDERKLYLSKNMNILPKRHDLDRLFFEIVCEVWSLSLQ